MRSCAKCFICGGKELDRISKDYLHCRCCGHEILNSRIEQGYIINEVLGRDEIEHLSSVDRFKINTLRRCLTSDNQSFLLDIGSSSGKFLFHSQRYFKKTAGLEINAECLHFSRNVLGLRVEEEIGDLKEPISFVTCWHSIEHIPPLELDTIFSQISKNATGQCTVLISVPNSNSLQYRFFREKYPYYDTPNHIHQFSPLSLRMFMERFGFQEGGCFFSLSYTAFGYLQGTLNFCNRIPNYLYYRKKRGWVFSQTKSALVKTDIYNYVLAALFMIPSFALAIIDLIWKERGGVITTCYRKKKH